MRHNPTRRSSGFKLWQSIAARLAQESSRQDHTAAPLPDARGTPARATTRIAITPDRPHLGTLGDRLNRNTIPIVSANPNATYLPIAYDMSAVLDDGDNFRILP